MVGLPTGPLRGEAPATLEPTARNGAPQDGPDGTGSAPFLAAPDAQGRRMPFAVVWSHLDDVSGGVVVRATGLNANRVRGTMSNTDVSDLMRETLFKDADASERGASVNAHTLRVWVPRTESVGFGGRVSGSGGNGGASPPKRRRRRCRRRGRRAG